ncbi:hypothetical protein EW146_g545 [Bondarzewia mesenterica]|uniref:Uncharacterized protein n=1 Tax=Bondarzewia mesenterica TaxID=1095465 RepID=A0A4S4MCX4_9AGAM|nr:hypothetical protein EW146_g545 [Bondarzewia mesenterica]
MMGATLDLDMTRSGCPAIELSAQCPSCPGPICTSLYQAFLPQIHRAAARSPLTFEDVRAADRYSTGVVEATSEYLPSADERWHFKSKIICQSSVHCSRIPHADWGDALVPANLVAQIRQAVLPDIQAIQSELQAIRHSADINDSIQA